MINLLLIGAGKFGKNYISTLANFQDVKLTVANRHNWQSLIDAKPNGVIIATPPSSHIEIATYALHKRIPTLIEKPLSLSLSKAETLLQFNSVPILVNHIYLFSETYQNIKRQIQDMKFFEQETYIEAIFTNNNLPREYSRLWDFAPHPISQIIDLLNEYPKSINCKKLANDRYNIGMKFNNCKTYSHVGFAQKSNRILDIGGKFLYDAIAANDQPLTNTLRVFIDAINGKDDYRLGLDLSMKVMKILNECEKQITNSVS